MPQCYRCERVQASAELRRTTLGSLCFDNARGSRCWQLWQARREREKAERRAARREAAQATERAEASVA